MNNIGFVTVSSIALALTFGCEPKSKVVTVEVPAQEKAYFFKENSSSSPIEVQQFDPNCKRGTPLTNDIIEQAYTGAELVQTLTSIQEDVNENGKPKTVVRQTSESETVRKARIVVLCQEPETVPANTLEGAAISMRKAADQAFALYQNVKTKGNINLPELERIFLSAAFRMKNVERKATSNDDGTANSSYITDNAMFMRLGKTSTLISYPQSESALNLGLFGGIPLWTVDGVFQHEFGHYLFANIMNQSSSSFDSYHKYAEQNPDLHMFQTPISSFVKKLENPILANQFFSFQATQDFFIGSLNEGFSDLWAYYTLNQPQNMFEIACFSKNRNISSDHFFNGMSKSWTDDMWAKIFNFQLQDLKFDTSNPIDVCSQPVFIDIHIIGAAMAHTVDAVFSAAILAESRDVQSSIKAEMALAWLKSLKESDEFIDLGGKASLSRILNLAIGTGISYLKSGEKASFCAVVQSKFPALVKRWKSSKTNNEDITSVVTFCNF